MIWTNNVSNVDKYGDMERMTNRFRLSAIRDRNRFGHEEKTR